MNSISQLFQEIPDFGEIVFYAVLVAVMIAGVVLGRYLIRGLVNRRVRGIQAEGLDLGDLSTMSQKGLLTPEELKLIRRRYAERQLEQTREQETGLKARDILIAIEADPSRATALLPPSSEHAHRALEGLKKSGGRSVEEQLRAQLGGSAATGGSASGRAEAPPPPAPPARPPRETRPEPRPREIPPAPAAPATGGPTAPAAKSGAAGMDLDAMLAQGLISRREYDLLMARVRKATNS